MGRSSTGAVTTGQCLQLPVAAFTKELKKGNHSFVGSITFHNGASIGVALTPIHGTYKLTLCYSTTVEGVRKDISYDVSIVSVPTNLGKGEVYYFTCPFSHKWCRTLYMGYQSPYFKSREAYRHRIYYASQLSSHLDKPDATYWRLDRQLKELYPKHPKTHYRGKVTKAQIRITRLEIKQIWQDNKRLQVMEMKLRRLVPGINLKTP